MLLQSNSQIADLPEVNIPRSTVNRSWREALTFDSGKLVPIFVDEMLPGQTRKLNSQWLCRMSTPIVPVLDDAYLDYFYFFVPNRLCWNIGHIGGYGEICTLSTKSIDIAIQISGYQQLDITSRRIGLYK